MFFAPLDQVNEFSDNDRLQANATTSNAGFINHIDQVEIGRFLSWQGKKKINMSSFT